MENVESLKQEIEMLKRTLHNVRSDFDELQDLSWDLFQNLDDSDSEELAKTCQRLVERYDFDVEELPETLHDNVQQRRAHDAKESYYDGQAEDVLWSQMKSGNLSAIANTLYG